MNLQNTPDRQSYMNVVLEQSLFGGTTFTSSISAVSDSYSMFRIEYRDNLLITEEHFLNRIVNARSPKCWSPMTLKFFIFIKATMKM